MCYQVVSTLQDRFDEDFLMDKGAFSGGESQIDCGR